MSNITTNILGINLHNISSREFKEKIDGFLASDKTNMIVTVNPEFILSAQKDEEFFYILNHADLALPDGIGLWFAGAALFENIHRHTGVKLARHIFENHQDKKIVVFNWQGGLQSAATLEAALLKRFSGPKLLIIDADRKNPKINWQEVADFKPTIALCTFGHGYQEKFLFHNLKNMPSLRLAAGVGGALDYLSGRIKRAPRFMRRFGLEWLFRLFRQPRRARRIWSAVVVFTLKFLKWRFILPFRYRPNVACLLYKNAENSRKIFLVERADDPGHWQIPQGGLSGDDIKTAGLKELREEANTGKIKYITHTGFIHKYAFPPDSPMHRGARYRKHTGYKGQKQALLIAEFTGRDEDIKINYWDHRGWKWVDADKVLEMVHENRRNSMREYIEIFKRLS